jgi:hypothetical protein
MEVNSCTMSYMWPSYHRIDNVDDSLHYALHLYREGGALNGPPTGPFDCRALV